MRTFLTACFHQAVKRDLRYFKGTSVLGLDYEVEDMNFSILVDSDYASDTKDRKSMSGIFRKICNSTVHSGAKKAHSVALSTCKAEYVSMSISGKEVVCIRKVLKDAGFQIKSPTLLLSDNISGISWATGEKLLFARAKHIDIRMHFIRELV